MQKIDQLRGFFVLFISTPSSSSPGLLLKIESMSCKHHFKILDNHSYLHKVLKDIEGNSVCIFINDVRMFCVTCGKISNVREEWFGMRNNKNRPGWTINVTWKKDLTTCDLNNGSFEKWFNDRFDKLSKSIPSKNWDGVISNYNEAYDGLKNDDLNKEEDCCGRCTPGMDDCIDDNEMIKEVSHECAADEKRNNFDTIVGPKNIEFRQDSRCKADVKQTPIGPVRTDFCLKCGGHCDDRPVSPPDDKDKRVRSLTDAIMKLLDID